MSIVKKAIATYRSEGITQVAKKGFQLGLSIIGADIPYYVWRNERVVDDCVARLEQSGIGKRLTTGYLQDYKTSNTVFILASGASINEITDKEWGFINNHDSIGLNRWPFHSHVPTYLVYEPYTGDNWRTWRNQYWKLLQEKREEYDSTPLIMKDLTNIQTDLIKSDIPSWVADRVLLSPDTNFSGIFNTLSKQKELINHLLNRGYFEPGTSTDYFYRKRGSVSYLIHLACVLDYENIVLCGVDMVNSKYFFEVGEHFKKIDVNVNELLPASDPQKSHSTVSKSINEATLDEIIYHMSSNVLQRYGIELYVENSISKLHPKIPLYEIPS